MLFAHDTEMSLASISELVNSAGRDGTGDGDTLAGPDALDGFVARWRWTGSRTHDAAELAAVQDLRGRLRRLWEADKDGVVEIVNTLLREHRALPQLVRHDGYDYHLHAIDAQAPLADRMAVDAAMAMVDVVRQGEFDRLRVCAADDCRNVLVDLSKNRSRRFCDTTCANRTNVAAFRARRRTEGRRTTDQDESLR